MRDIVTGRRVTGTGCIARAQAASHIEASETEASAAGCACDYGRVLGVSVAVRLVGIVAVLAGVALWLGGLSAHAAVLMGLAGCVFIAFGQATRAFASYLHGR
jgi:hypothetical protein